MIILALLMTGLAPLPGSGAQKNRYTVLIDPAHGGDEAGVVVDKLREKDLNLNLALLIRQEAQKGANFQVQLTRSTDRTMTVSERIKAVGDIESGLPSDPACQCGFWEKGGRL